MIAVDYGEDPPPIVPAAKTLYAALDLHRAFGTIPIHADLRVFVIGDLLAIAVGGLDDCWLLGTHTDRATERTIPPEHHTGAALQLGREIDDIVHAHIPRRTDGEPWFAVLLWLQPHCWAEQFINHSHGVTVLNRGEFP